MGTKEFRCLGDWFRHGDAVAVRCRSCGRMVELDPGPLLMRHGYGRHPRDLPWRCASCGSKNVAVGIDARLGR